MLSSTMTILVCHSLDSRSFPQKGSSGPDFCGDLDAVVEYLLQMLIPRTP